MAPGRVGVAKLLRTRSFPGGQRLPALLRREQRRHSLAPHCDPPQRRLHTGSHRPSLGSYFRLRPPRARLASPRPPALFITAAAPLGFARPPSHSPQPPNLRPDRGNPDALRPPSCAGSRSLLGSQARWAALPAHLPPPLPAPHPPSRSSPGLARLSLGLAISLQLFVSQPRCLCLSQSFRSVSLRLHLVPTRSGTALGPSVSSPVLCPLVCL